MEKNWTIRCVYAQGGHIHQPEGKPVYYDSKQKAAAVCEVLNAVNRKPDMFYIPVEAEG